MSKVLIVGRENVGKSTFFNCLSRQKAITLDYCGVTRDFKEGVVKDWFGFQFDLIDAPGFGEAEHLSKRILPETIDLILFMVDGSKALDEQTAQIGRNLRKLNKPVVLLINKVDRKDCDPTPYYGLGFQEYCVISAAHKDGLEQLIPFFTKHLQEKEPEPPSSLPKIAIMGRPNSGKSTLTNSYLGYERQLTGETPGITRDAITIPVHYNKLDFLLVDTAGIRKRTRVQDELEKMSIQSAFSAMRHADGIIYLIDATLLTPYGLHHQDMMLLSEIIKEGRCVCIGFNKWDQIKDKTLLEELKYLIHQKIFDMADIPCIPISAQNKKGINALINTMCESIKHFDQKISTGRLNRWIRRLEKTPPSIGGKPTKIKYIVQKDTKPPTFTLFANRYHTQLESYERYLRRQMTEAFNLKGIPIRFNWQVSKNPYH